MATAFKACLLLAMIFSGIMAFGSLFNENFPMACTYFVGALFAYWLVKWMDPEAFKEKKEPSFEEFHEVILHGPSSSLIPFHKAKVIAGKFGDLIVELCAPKRLTDSADQNKKMLTMPVERLGYSKEQVQTALAVVIAEMVVVLATKPSDQDEKYLRAAAAAASSVGRFYRQPEGWKNFSFEEESTRVYYGWIQKCEDCWGKLIAAQPALLRENPDTSVPWGMALTEYWEEIDRMIPELLKDPWLTGIRGA
jgi:hypothetical protein